MATTNTRSAAKRKEAERKRAAAQRTAPKTSAPKTSAAKPNSRTQAQGKNQPGQAVTLPNRNRSTQGVTPPKTTEAPRTNSRSAASGTNGPGQAVRLPNRAAGPSPTPPSAPPRTASSISKGLSGLKGGIVGAGIYAVGERVTNAVGQRAGEQLGKALKPLGRAIDERRAANKDTKGGRRQNLRGGRSTGGQPSRPIANLPPSANQPSQYPAGVGTRQASSPGAPARSTNDGQARRQSAQRASSGSVTPSSGSSRPSPARPSQAAPRTTTGGSEKGSGSAPGTRRWEDFNKGRGTSETNNPLIKNNAWLMSKIKEREERESKKMDDDDKKKKSAAVKAGWDGNKNY